jgi:hypothetical protein
MLFFRKKPARPHIHTILAMVRARSCQNNICFLTFKND